MSEDRLQPTDPAVAAQLVHWQDAVGAPRRRGAWRGPAKYATAALLVLFFVPLAVRYMIFSPLGEFVGGDTVLVFILALPFLVIYGVFRFLR